MAIGDITITYEREQAVDFTMPWMNLGKYIFVIMLTTIQPIFIKSFYTDRFFDPVSLIEIEFVIVYSKYVRQNILVVEF